MRIDSHRLREPSSQPLSPSTTAMPCPRRTSAMLTETESNETGLQMYTWRAVRRQHLHKLRKCTRAIFLFMSFMELLRCGVFDVVYAGRHGSKAPSPEDYGIAHFGATVIGWLYMCLFAIIYVPTLSWWLPKLMSSAEQNSDAGTSGNTESVAAFFQKINNVLLPLCIGLAIMEHIYHVVSAFYHVEGRPVDADAEHPRKMNARRCWVVRLLLLGGVLASVAVGSGVLKILEDFDLARVKPIERWIIVLPAQINIGILVGSVVQYKMEQRNAVRQTARAAIDAEAALHEKQSQVD